MNEKTTIKAYLLGMLAEETQIRALEEKLFLVESFSNELSIAENHLIEDYLEETLTEVERQCFERHFLAHAERRQKLRLVQNLRKYAETNKINRLPTQTKDNDSNWKHFFSWKPVWAVACAVLFLVAGLGVWRLAFYQSDVDKGLAQMQIAYRNQRPFESRSTGDFTYAPYLEMRGNAPEVDAKAKIRAEGFLLDATEDAANAKAHQALGILYLADKKYDAALGEFAAAAAADSSDAGIYSDTGAAFLEKAGQAERGKNFDETMQNMALAIKNFDRALELNPSFKEALFNEALTLQKFKQHQQAKSAWEKYLETDSTSAWAAEARKNLEKLKQQENLSKTNSEVLQDFLGAYQNKDDALAWRITSQTKELITDVMIQPQLVGKFLEADGQSRKEDAQVFLSAFSYLGELEKQNADDFYFAELADYYSKINRAQQEKNLRAAANMQMGYRFISKPKWNSALDSFTAAKSEFLEAGNDWEAQIAEYQIAYALCQLKQIAASNERLIKLSDFAERKKYKWLQSISDGWLGNNYALLGEHSKAIEYGEKALAVSDRISDTHNSQKALNQLSNEYALIGNLNQTLSGIYRSDAFTDLYYQSRRQRSRNLFIAADGMLRSGFYNAAAYYAAEQVYVADEEIKDVWLSHTAHNNLALIYGKNGKYQEAFREIETSFQLANSFAEESMRKKQEDRTRLILANLQKDADLCGEAVVNYSRVIQSDEYTEFSINEYEARKGRLLCSIAQKDNVAVQKEMPEILKMFDENRQKIALESERNVFFDKEQNVYDAAADYAFTELKDSGQSFQYAENSRARSLLNLLQPAVSEPLSLSEIRARIPPDVQVVYYAVLADRILIWQISESKFIAFEQPVKTGELNEKVQKYLDLLINRADNRALARELYGLLLQPLEPTLEADKTLCIIADKTLFKLPFAALVSPKTGKYLIENYALIYAPSATVFINETEIARRKSVSDAETFLSVGNPAFSRKQYPDLANLPDAEKEAEAAATNYQSRKVLIKTNAAKEKVVAGFNQSDVIHFAGHYVSDDKSPQFSKLLLASGDLTVEEIMRNKTQRARLIVLSACDTGTEKYYDGEGMIGAARAFMAAGIPLVVASYWSVDSAAAGRLMIKFHQYRKTRMSSVEALRQAQIAMLTEKNTESNQPYFWAGFFAVGGYAAY